MKFPFFSRPKQLAKAPRRCKHVRHLSYGFERLEDRRMLATIPVSLAFDAGDIDGADGGITLREAIRYVNKEFVPIGDRSFFDFANLGTNDKIVFDSSVFGVGPGLVDTITLTAGELDITESVTIDASALSGGLTIDASGNDPTPNSTLDDGNPFNDGDGSRVFDIIPSSGTYVFTLKGLSLTGGDVDPAFATGGAVWFRGGGGTPEVRVVDSVITGNSAGNVPWAIAA